MTSNRSCWSAASRAALFAAGISLLLTGCSPTFDYVVVRKSDGYFVSGTSCPLSPVASVLVVGWNDGEEVGDQWTAEALTPQGATLPVGGLAIGRTNDGFDTRPEAIAPLSEDTAIKVRVTTVDGGHRSGAYNLGLDVGEYRDPNGGSGSWAELVSEQPCLQE